MNQWRLIKQSKAGQAESFEKLLNLYSEQLYLTAFLYVRNREDALDIVQETSYRAYVGLPNLKKDRYFSTWLMRILMNTACEFLKKNPKNLDIDTVEIGFYSNEMAQITQLDLLDVLEDIREEYRDVLLLFYFHDLTIKQIAEVMAIPASTVKTFLRRGKEVLKVRLKGAYGNENEEIPTKIPGNSNS